MNINKLAGMFGVKTYEEENKQLHSDFDNLARTYDITKGANDVLARQIISLEKELDLIRSDCEQYIEQEVERRLMAIEEKHLQGMKHRLFAEGRMAAYSEMGIWRLNAIARGNVLARLTDDPDGEIVELITDLEDVKAQGEQRVDFGDLPDEIIIDDLIDVGA